MRKISWQWLQRIAVLIAFGLLVGLVAIGQGQRPNTPPREAQEEEAREAAFLYLFDVGTGPDPNYSIYCLSIDGKGTDWGDDPSDELMKRFPKTRHTLRKLSECEISKPKDLMSPVKDKKTGKFAWMVSISSIEWENEHEIRIGAERYCGGLYAWGSTLKATLEKGKWKVVIAPGAYIWVS